MPLAEPNLLAILAAYERVVADLLHQRDQQCERLRTLVVVNLQLRDQLDTQRLGKFILCRRCAETFRRGGTRSKYCPVCRPIAKAEKDKQRWIASGKAARARRRVGMQTRISIPTPTTTTTTTPARTRAS